jgi:hypothetical protein
MPYGTVVFMISKWNTKEKQWELYGLQLNPGLKHRC